MILRTRNERVLYRALESLCNVVNRDNAGLMMDVAIVQADNEIPHSQKVDLMMGAVQVAQVNGQPTPEDL